jgi:hypothetical protein
MDTRRVVLQGHCHGGSTVLAALDELTAMLAHGRAVTMDAMPLDLARFARGEAHVEPLTFV